MKTVTDKASRQVQQIFTNSVPCDRIDRPPTVPAWTYAGISKITDNLLLTSAMSARPDYMSDMGVTCVINATCELPDTPLPDTPVEYVRIPVIDRNETDLSVYFDRVADLIEQIRQRDGVVLIHCVAGVSRSATLCIAYLMKHKGMSLRKSFQHVKSIRPQIRPNGGFWQQLIEFERALHGHVTVTFVFNEVTMTEIPDVYQADYEQMLIFQKKYKSILYR